VVLPISTCWNDWSRVSSTTTLLLLLL